MSLKSKQSLTLQELPPLTICHVQQINNYDAYLNSLRDSKYTVYTYECATKSKQGSLDDSIVSNSSIQNPCFDKHEGKFLRAIFDLRRLLEKWCSKASIKSVFLYIYL